MYILIFSQVFVELNITPSLTAVVDAADVKAGSLNLAQVEVAKDAWGVVQEVAERSACGSKVEEALGREKGSGVEEDEGVVEDIK